MRIHCPRPGPSWAQERRARLPGLAGEAYAPIVGPGWAWLEAADMNGPRRPRRNQGRLELGRASSTLPFLLSLTSVAISMPRVARPAFRRGGDGSCRCEGPAGCGAAIPSASKRCRHVPCERGCRGHGHPRAGFRGRV
eukprot:2156138-Pyramimonas_sp.AAC.1